MNESKLTKTETNPQIESVPDHIEKSVSDRLLKVDRIEIEFNLAQCQTTLNKSKLLNVLSNVSHLGSKEECLQTFEDFLASLGERGIKIQGETQVFLLAEKSNLSLNKSALGNLIETHSGSSDLLITPPDLEWAVLVRGDDVFATDRTQYLSFPRIVDSKHPLVSLGDNLEAAIMAGSNDNQQQVEIDGVLYSNYSEMPLAVLINLLPRDLQADEIVFMPDVNPGKAPLPTGTALLTKDPNWRKYAISDCGCGMQLVKTELSFDDFQKNLDAWDELGRLLKKNKGKLGDLGGGNHFVDAIVSYEDERVSVLIHTGSRLESGLVDRFVDRPGEFEDEFNRIVEWAKDNRYTVASAVERVYGQTEFVLDLHHNSFEQRSDGSVLIRKGVVASTVGSLNVLPSHMTGDVSLLTSTSKVNDVLNSLSHGTGRAMSRSQAKETHVDFQSLRRSIYIPDYIQDMSIKTEAPHCYRSLDRCLELLGDLVTEQERFAVVAYLGRL